jgi:hypothetical protein
MMLLHKHLQNVPRFLAQIPHLVSQPLCPQHSGSHEKGRGGRGRAKGERPFAENMRPDIAGEVEGGLCEERVDGVEGGGEFKEGWYKECGEGEESVMMGEEKEE